MDVSALVITPLLGVLNLLTLLKEEVYWKTYCRLADLMRKNCSEEHLRMLQLCGQKSLEKELLVAL